MFITELFTKTIPWQYTGTVTDNDHRAEFSSGGFAYIVDITDFHHRVEMGGPHEEFKNVFSVTFTQYSEKEGSVDSITGSGNAIAILTTVMEIMKDVIEIENIQTFMFTADNREPSRVKLYNRMASQLEKKGWRYIGPKEVQARSDIADDDFDPSHKPSSVYILTKQPHPHSLMKGTRA